MSDEARVLRQGGLLGLAGNLVMMASLPLVLGRRIDHRADPTVTSRIAAS